MNLNLEKSITSLFIILVVLSVYIENGYCNEQSETQKTNLYMYGPLNKDKNGNVHTLKPEDNGCMQILCDKVIPNYSIWIGTWWTEPIKKPILIEGNIMFYIWATSDELVRNVRLGLYLEWEEPDGSGGFWGGWTQESDIDGEPIEFTLSLSLPHSYNFPKNTKVGLRMEYEYSLPSTSQISIIYDCIDYDSHMEVFTNGVMPRIILKKLDEINEKVHFSTLIIDAFGLDDIFNYSVKIDGPVKGNAITILEVIELEEGLNISWCWNYKIDSVKNGEYQIQLDVVDNSGNVWSNTDILEITSIESSQTSISGLLLSITTLIVMCVLCFIFLKTRKN